MDEYGVLAEYLPLISFLYPISYSSIFINGYEADLDSHLDWSQKIKDFDNTWAESAEPKPLWFAEFFIYKIEKLLTINN